MPATQLKSNKGYQRELFSSSFHLVCLPSLQLMTEKKKKNLREHHTCDFTQAFPSEIGHTNLMIFSPANKLNTVC